MPSMIQQLWSQVWPIKQSVPVTKAVEVICENYIIDPPVDPLFLAKVYGLDVVEGVFGAEYKNISGIIQIDEKRIVINSEDTTNEQAFTIAHELGHWLLHKEELLRNPDIGVFRRKPIGSQSQDPKEREANIFAAHLLVPEKPLKKYKFLPVYKLIDVFGVPEDVIGFRIQNSYGF